MRSTTAASRSTGRRRHVHATRAGPTRTASRQTGTARSRRSTSSDPAANVIGTEPVRKRRLVEAKGRARATRAHACSFSWQPLIGSLTPMQTELHSIDDLLAVMVERNASDLHLTAGSPPVIRVKGRLERLSDHEKLTPEEIRTLMYRILSTEQQKTLETRRQIDFSHSIPGLARFRVNAYFQRAAVGAAFRLIPDKIKTLEELGLPTRLYELADKPRGPRARHRADRLRQVDDPRLAPRPHQPLPARAHPHHRGPDRVPAPPRDVHRQPARDRPGRDDVRRGASRRAAPGPRRDPRRRDARPRDGRDRAHRSRDRAPRVRDAAHPERADHDRPRHRRLPGRAAGPGARAARVDAPGRRHAEPRADRRRPRPHGRARGPDARRRRPQPDPPGEGRADLLGHADEHVARDADDGAVARRPGAPQRHHARACVRALLPARSASGPARALGPDEFHRTGGRQRQHRRRQTPAQSGLRLAQEV